MKSMKYDFRYKSSLYYVFSALIFLLYLAVLINPLYGLLTAIIGDFVVLFFIFYFHDAKGHFETDDNTVRFVTVGKDVTIPYSDIKSASVENEYIEQDWVTRHSYYIIHLEIKTADKDHYYSCMLSPDMHKAANDPNYLSRQINGNDFAMLCELINYKIKKEP